MKYLRWYDKDSSLKEFMNLLESLDSKSIDLLAQDFIQIIMNSGFINSDKIIDMLNKNSSGKYNRWYDRDYNLHTCVELLKSLPNDKKEILLENFKESCFEFITNVYYEQK